MKTVGYAGTTGVSKLSERKEPTPDSRRQLAWATFLLPALRPEVNGLKGGKDTT
jgi:hypothetical protein